MGPFRITDAFGKAVYSHPIEQLDQAVSTANDLRYDGETLHVRDSEFPGRVVAEVRDAGVTVLVTE